MTAGIKILHPSGLTAGLHLRHIGDRPANEDFSIIAPGYTIADMNLSYDFGMLKLGIQVQNVLDSEWNETQFATESRLDFESDSVEEIHFTPGTPRFIKGILQYSF